MQNASSGLYKICGDILRKDPTLLYGNAAQLVEKIHSRKAICVQVYLKCCTFGI